MTLAFRRILSPMAQESSPTSVEHVTRDDYLQEDLKKEIEEFNERLEQCLSDENFVIEGDGNFDSMYLDDIDDDDNNAGVAANQGITPTEEEYGDMLAEERPEADDEEAVDKYLNAELCLDLGTNNERRGRVCKRLRGLDGEPMVARILTPCLIRESMRLSSPMEREKSTRQM